MISVQVVFATVDHQEVIDLNVDRDSTLAEAVAKSGIIEKFPHIDFVDLKKGVWNRVQSEDYRLKDGDRIEIYRELEIDPKEARRQRANKKN